MVRKKGFTLLELLLVMAILGIFASYSVNNYIASIKKSRDGRRSADLQQIRGALELFRSNIGSYPQPTGTYGLPFGTSGLTDSLGNTYMTKIPQDGKPGQTYYYTQSSDDYTLAANLEVFPQPTCAVANTDCGTADGLQSCNYCVGPYGEK